MDRDHAFLGTLLTPVSHGFAWGAAVRRRLYEAGTLRARRLPRPVISVGNLVVGGVGKTPVTALIASWLRDGGHRVAIISRGYRRKSRGMVVVSDGERVTGTVETAGDEPLLMARALPGVAVVVDSDRGRAGGHAIDELGADVLLLDDGFQHLRLARDIDIVLVAASDDLSRARLLPAGRYREAPSALARADIILLTRAHQTPDLAPIHAQVARLSPEAAVVPVENRPLDLVDSEGMVSSLQGLSGKRLVALSSIGDPEQFERDLGNLGGDVVATVRFRDHHAYREQDLQRVEERFRVTGADLVVTTTKDLVRLEAVLPAPGGERLTLRALRMEPQLSDARSVMDRLEAVARSGR